MLDILREFKVPVGLSDQEKAKFSKYYETEDKKRWFAWLRKGRRSEDDDSLLNDHSKCVYLMGPEN